MKHSFPRTAALVAASLALPAWAAAEDLTVVSTLSTGKGAPTTSTQYMSASKVRTSDGENDTIFDVATGNITVINHKKKEYYQFTAEEMRAAMAQFEEQMKGPMGGLMEKMMGGKIGEVTVTKAGATRTVAGTSCDTYVVAMGENMRQEICAASSIAVPVQYYDARKAGYAMMGPAARRFEKFYDEMKKVKGFPIASTTNFKIMGMNTTVTQEATEIRKGAIPASAFEVPAGYKKKDSPFKQK